jgi:hypothetical protein
MMAGWLVGWFERLKKMNLKPYTTARAYRSSQKLNIYLFSPLRPYNAADSIPAAKTGNGFRQPKPSQGNSAGR